MGRKVTEEEYLQRMKKQHSDIEVIGKYINFKTKVALRCKKDSYEWEATPNKTLNCNHGCPKCGGSLPLTHKEFVNQMKEINSNIQIDGFYINDSTKIACTCLICGNRWENRPTHLKKGEKCPICSKKECSENLAKTLEQFKQELFIINPDIKILSNNYTNGKTKVKCKCLLCNHIWWATPVNLLKERGCPKCKKISKYERKIAKWLDKNNIKYEMQYTYKQCKDKRELPFDFYIVDYNFLLEYDGEQHFWPVCFGGISLNRAIHNYLETLRRDKIKNDFCKENKIFLFRIPYWYSNKIDLILEKYLKIYKGGFDLGQFLMTEWHGKDKKKHKGFIDKDDPYMSLRKDEFPENIDKLKLFNFKRDKVVAYERAQSAINQGLAIFPNSINARNELEFEVLQEDGSMKIRYEKVSTKELAPLVELDLMKEEIVATQKTKTSNGTIRFELSPDAKSRGGHDDRVDCAVMILNRLMELRAKQALEVETKESDFKSFFNKAGKTSNNFNSSNPFGGTSNPFKNTNRSNLFKH